MIHILIAEDQASGRFILTHALKGEGYKVTAAEDGLEALNLIVEANNENNQFDLLVTDIHMPNMTGPELFDELIRLGISIPSLVMTAFGSKHLVIDLMRKGVSEYLDKPFEPKELIERVAELLKRNEAERLKRDAKFIKASEENAKILSEAAADRFSFDKLKKEIDLAKGAYNELIKINEADIALKFAYKTRPLADLGGDFLNIKRIGNHTDLIIADVAGHDMGASFHTILVKTLFDDGLPEGANISLMFDKFNKVLSNNGQNDRMVTAQFLRYYIDEQKIEIISAGHPYPIKIEKKFPIPRPILVKGDVLGLYEDPKFEIYSLKVAQGTRIILHTDGLTDLYRYNEKTGGKDKLPTEFLDNLVDKYFELPLKEMIDAIWEDLLKYCNYKYKDDMTILAIEIL